MPYKFSHVAMATIFVRSFFPFFSFFCCILYTWTWTNTYISFAPNKACAACILEMCGCFRVSRVLDVLVPFVFTAFSIFRCRRRRWKAVRHCGSYTVYLLFFPLFFRTFEHLTDINWKVFLASFALLSSPPLR